MHWRDALWLPEVGQLKGQPTMTVSICFLEALRVLQPVSGSYRCVFPSLFHSLIDLQAPKEQIRAELLRVQPHSHTELARTSYGPSPNVLGGDLVAS